ncbi:helix-turn-helix domain-containing protein, partial [Methylosinus sp. 3S-1]
EFGALPSVEPRLTMYALRYILLKTTETQMKAPASHETAFRDATSADPLREAFLRRSIDTITRIAAHADPKILSDALAASTGFGALARVLADTATTEASLVDLDPIAPLVARNAGHRVQILDAAGGTLSSNEVAQLLGVSRQAIEKRRRANALLAVRMGRDWRYPRCQFDEAEGTVVAGLPKLLDVFARSGPWVAMDFLLTADEVLGNETPMQRLRREGLTPELERLARVEQGDGFA